MSENKIEKLKSYKQQILLLEIGALIHDIGKLNEYFIERKSLERSNDYDHGEVLKHDSCEKQDYKPTNPHIKENAEKVKQLLENTRVFIDEDLECSLHHLITAHHGGNNNNITKILIASDRFDSVEDRGNACDAQSICDTYKSNAFGHEESIHVDYEEERKKVYEQIIDALNIFEEMATREEGFKNRRKEFFELLQISFENALGMTARAANDVSLWEHSYMTASICKALFNWEILQPDFPEEEGFPNLKSKQDIEDESPFKIFSIGWDYDEFLAQAEKIPDVIGRIEILKEIKEEIRDEIEVEFSLGNCIYEDYYGLHFLIPAVFEEEDLIQVVDEVQKTYNKMTNGILTPFINLSGKGAGLTKLLPKTIEELKSKTTERSFSFGEKTFEPGWTSDWSEEDIGSNGNSSGDKLICFLCGKSFYHEGDDEKVCEACKYLRKKGRIERPPQTRFTDEISWQDSDYGYVGLFTLNFNLEGWLGHDSLISTMLINRLTRLKAEKVKGLYDLGDNGINLGAVIAWLKGSNVPKENVLEEIREGIAKIEPFEELNEEKKELENILNRVQNNGREEVDEENIESLNKDIKEKAGNNANTLLKQLTGEGRHGQKKDIIHKYDITEIMKRLSLKSACPSRLMRVWNSTKYFFEELIKDLCEEAHLIDRYRIKPNNGELERLERLDSLEGSALEISFNGQKGKCILKKDGRKHFLTVAPNLNRFLEKRVSEEIEFKLEDYDEALKGKAEKAPKARGFRVISVSPTEFMFLFPADKTLDVLELVQRRYIESFGKVYGKLPLNIGIVFGKRKTPMFSLIDASRRFIRGFNSLHGRCSEMGQEELPSLTVKDVEDGRIETEEGYIIEASRILGNGKRDPYHPFLMIRDSEMESEVVIETENGIICEKHVDLVEKGNRISIMPSVFDFQFLDSNTRRFGISYRGERADADLPTRNHETIGEESPRPYLIEDVQRFQRLWRIFETIGSWGPLRDVEVLAASKRQEWNIGELDEKGAYKRLIDSALENRLSRFFSKEEDWKQNKPFLRECIMEGSFFDAVELFESIMKVDLKGGENV